MVVIANSRVARFLVNAGPGSGLVPSGGGTLRADPPRPYADRAGAVHNRIGPGVSAVEQSDPKAQAEAEFAIKLNDHLEESFGQGEFSRLLVVAGPHMLGQIREVLSGKLSSVVLAEVDKDLTRISVKDLPKHLGHVMAV
jgi:hypothetical protein